MPTDLPDAAAEATTQSLDAPHSLDAQRELRNRLRGDARQILERARSESRAATDAELHEVEGITERVIDLSEQIDGQTLEALRRSAVRSQPAGSVPARPDLSAAAIVVTQELLEDAAASINGRRPMRRSLSRAAIGIASAGGGMYAAGDAWPIPNRLFDVLRVVESRSQTDSALVLNLSTPGIGPVAQSAPKPDAATAAVVTEDKSKLSGIVEFTYELRVFVPDVEQALRDTMLAGLVAAENKVVVDALAAVPATAFVESAATSILVGQATAAMAGSASVVLLNPADVATVFGQATADGAYAVVVDSRTAQTQIWGMRAFFSPAVAAGFAYVIDPLAVTAFIAQAPEFTVEWTNLRTNELAIIVDEFASVICTRPAACTKVALTGVVTASASRSSK